MMQSINTTNGHVNSNDTPPFSSRSRSRSALAKATCPVCKSADRSDKVSNVVRSGRGKLIFGNGETARYETELADLLGEPEKPKAISILRAAVDALPPLMTLLGILVALSLLRAQDYVAVPPRALEVSRNIGMAWFCVLIPGVLLLRWAQSRLDLERQLPVWTIAHRRWTALYYCSRDDVVFSPILKAIAAPEEIHGMLYVSIDTSGDSSGDRRETAGPIALPESR
jgi:hypothetical protein